MFTVLALENEGLDKIICSLNTAQTLFRYFMTSGHVVHCTSKYNPVELDILKRDFINGRYFLYTEYAWYILWGLFGHPFDMTPSTRKTKPHSFHLRPANLVHIKVTSAKNNSDAQHLFIWLSKAKTLQGVMSDIQQLKSKYVTQL